MQQASPAFSQTVALSDEGLLLGAQTHLAHFAEGTRRLDLDPERLTGLLATAFGRPPSAAHLSAIESAASRWQRGDKAVANLRLVFANLPVIDAPAEVYRLKAAELLFDAGMTAADIAAHLGTEASGLGKYDPDERRVPPGEGRDSGRWTNGLWARFRAWLDEEVPEYDQDTGDVVGTRSRAKAIATNPLTILAVGAVAILAGEVLLPLAVAGGVAEVVAAATTAVEETEVLAPVVSTIAEAAAPIADESEALTAWAQRYLTTSGGRLGSTATRKQLYEIAKEYFETGEYVELKGDGYGSEEFIPDPGGGTYVDFTAIKADGSIVRVQTVDTLSDGVTLTARERAAAARIQRLRPDDKLITTPKKRP